METQNSHSWSVELIATVKYFLLMSEIRYYICKVLKTEHLNGLEVHSTVKQTNHHNVKYVWDSIKIIRVHHLNK